MRTSRSTFAAVAAAAFVLGSFGNLPASAEASAPTGLWLDESGRGAIEISTCGDNLCGRLVWVKGETKDARAACGAQIIGDVKRIDEETWNGGWIYSPELKSRFDVEIKPIDGDSLQVTGFAGTRDLSETMVWRRAPSDIGRCEPVERAGYVEADVASKRGDAARSAAAVGAAAAIKSRVSAKEKARAERASVRVAARGGDRPGHRHTANCHVRAPFVNVSFRCSSKASRVLARLF